MGTLIRVPPGSFILEEMAARHWTVDELAKRMGVRTLAARYVITGEPITEDVAERLGKAFGTSARLWLNLGRAFREPDKQSGARPQGD